MPKAESALLILLGVLFAVWPVPHTSTLRYVFLAACLITAIVLMRRRAVGYPWQTAALRPTLFFIGAYTAWILFVALVISPETSWSLGEIRGQWLWVLLALTIGSLAAAVLRGKHAEAWLIYVLVIPLAFHVLAVDGAALFQIVQKGGLADQRISGLTEEIDKASYLSNMLLAILLAELLVRSGRGRGVLPQGPWFVAGAVTVTLLSMFFERARNGVGVVAVMLLCWIVLWFIDRGPSTSARWKRALALVATIVAVVSVLVLALVAKPGMHMQRTLDTIPVALDTETHKGWLDVDKYGLPSLPDGSQVDSSAYMRIAWFKEGLVLAAEKPLGVGFGRNAFGHALQAKYGEGRGHSHSSFVDLLVGVGIPGLVLWLGVLGSLAWLGLRQFHGTGGVYWLALFFITVDFGTRMLVDSNVRDHMLQMFMFAAGLLAVSAVQPKAGASRRRS